MPAPTRCPQPRAAESSRTDYATPAQGRWPARVGVGLAYLPGRPEYLTELLPELDYLELSPETFAQQLPDGRMLLDQPAVSAVLDLIGELPVAAHGLELSIGSAHAMNEFALQNTAEFMSAFAPGQVRWHSEHLNFLTTGAADGSVVSLGLPMPLPFTDEVAELVGNRAAAVTRRFGLPFLLENSANYLPDLPVDPGWDEARLLTEISADARCGLLLDLYNLWTNCVNHRLDPMRLLAGIPLDRVVEVHLAGGEERNGLLLDSHSAQVSEPVWRLLEHVLLHAPNLAGVTVEVLDIYADRLGVDGIATQLAIASDLWNAARSLDRT
ncbi:MAG: hypothetical protein JWN95_3242 [Frankiales bacterium]|nr:hypothetical protein [Frankiales bacterium]